jgi:tRNA(fMet)-specific endonuclease VapC
LRRASGSGRPLAVSSIVLFELRYGIARSDRQARNADLLDALLEGGIASLPFDSEDAIGAGELRVELERAGQPIGPYDLLIAAQALRHNATLVTANTAEFSRVPGLSIEDWTT